MTISKIAAAKALGYAVLALADSEGVQLAKDTEGDGCRHPELLASAIEGYDALPERPTADDDAIVEWAVAARKARDEFWAAYEGTVVDGVTIIRRR